MTWQRVCVCQTNIKTDSSDNMSKKAAVVGSSNSVDMSDTIYARPQAKNEAGNNDGTDMAENLLNDMNQTSETGEMI